MKKISEGTKARKGFAADIKKDSAALAKKRKAAADIKARKKGRNKVRGK